MQIKQISIFEFVESDDIKENLKSLQLEKEVELLGFMVRLTDHGYEIENEELHVGFLDFEECYRKIHSQLLKESWNIQLSSFFYKCFLKKFLVHIYKINISCFVCLYIV